MIKPCHKKALIALVGDAMNKHHLLGVVIGLSASALAINHSVPQFFTVEHAQLLHETLVPDRLLPRHFVDPETSSGSALFRSR